MSSGSGPVNPGPGGLAAAARAVARAPLRARTRRELLFCLAEVPLGLALFAAPAALAVVVLVWRFLLWGVQGGTPSPGVVSLGVSFLLPLLLLLLLVTMIPRIGRGLGRTHRALAAALLGVRVGEPAAPRRGHGPGRLLAPLRDGPGWRSAAYQLVKLPVLVVECYAVFSAALGVTNLTYPFWWPLFRNHAPGTRLGPVDVLTPFGAFHVATFAGTWAAFAAGAAMVLTAPWMARAGAAADVWLMRGMLGPGRLAQRVADLEQTRALAVEDSAALLRRLERDLHDGAQIRLATLAMNLGLAREKLTADYDPQVRDLVESAHQGAKDALVDLRNLARGIHPPALDNGLADALATLAAGSVVPVTLTADLPRRPAPAIETIAYFCAAELLANAAKHSGAGQIEIGLAEIDAALLLRVSDDGRGGADPARGSGLSGLAQRARTVDGRIEVVSPEGGPTTVTVTLPLHA
jgi:signal transduction histidine kinase